MIVIKYKDKIICTSSNTTADGLTFLTPVRFIALPDVPAMVLPLGLFRRGYREADWNQFYKWVQTRAFPQERIGADKLLKMLGLEEYSILAIVQQTKGVMTERDKFSIEWLPDDYEIKEEEKYAEGDL